MHGTHFKHAHADEAGEEYRWGVVRNPLERLVSAYSYFCVSDNLEGQPELRALGYYKGMKWVEFLGHACFKHNEDPHTRFQAIYLGPFGFDRLGRLENLDDEWRMLRRAFPIIERDVLLTHKSDHGDWKAFYDPAVRRHVELIFAADLDLYESAST